MKKKLIICIITLSLLIVTLVTSTWAYINYLEAYVSNIQFEAQSDGYAYMSVDGVNYSLDLGLEDIKKAVVAKYYNYEFDSTGSFVDTAGNQVSLKDKQIDLAYKRIQFSPLTSSDGINMKYVNSSGETSSISASSGMYVSFDLYFKSIVDEDFNLYFNTDDINTDLNESVVKITSEESLVNSSNFSLTNGFSCYNFTNGDIINYGNESELTIKAADAIRFSTTIEDKTKIYEPNLGLGSYATDLDSDLYSGNFKTYSSRFDSDKNAAFTYTKNYGYEYEPLAYEDMPNTYQSFEEMDSLEIVSFSAKDEVKMVNFNFWLEGYDADCFQAITGSVVKILLSFRGSNTLETYTINYHDEEEISSIEYINSAIKTGNTPLFPVKKGYVFEGWYSDNSYQTEFDFDEVIVINNQVRNAYAKWRKI